MDQQYTLRSRNQEMELASSHFKCIFEFSFQFQGKVSRVRLLASDLEINFSTRFLSSKFASPLLPPFNSLWQMAQNVREILLKIESQRLTFVISGEPFVFYYLLRMITWLPEKHSVTLINFLEITPTSNFLIRKMNDYVIKTVENFILSSDINFPTNYLDCAACKLNEKPASDSDTKLLITGIDVVIPTKDVEQPELERCINSVLPQLSENDLIYLVNDNGTESKICEKIARISSRIIVIQGSRAGIAATRNIGAREGENPLIAFIDSDDYVLPNYLQLQRDFHFRYPDVSATGTWIQAFGSHELIYPQWDGISPIGLLSCLPPAGVLMWKREAILKLGFFREEFSDGFEDFDLVARAISSKFKVIVLDYPLYRYRRGHKSLSQTWTKTREIDLHNKVAGNLQNLCRHEFNEYLDLTRTYSHNLLLSHPDLVFRGKEKFKRKPARNILNKMWIETIQRFRNVIWARRLWNYLHPSLRSKVVNFLIK
jgi:glycosyltransferase involved in cell wall biosynthesis